GAATARGRTTPRSVFPAASVLNIAVQDFFPPLISGSRRACPPKGTVCPRRVEPRASAGSSRLALSPWIAQPVAFVALPDQEEGPRHQYERSQADQRRAHYVTEGATRERESARPSDGDEHSQPE